MNVKRNIKLIDKKKKLTAYKKATKHGRIIVSTEISLIDKKYITSLMHSKKLCKSAAIRALLRIGIESYYRTKTFDETIVLFSVF